MATTTSPITYRKTKQGQWVAYGPVSEVEVGMVRITKANGEVVRKIVERVGRPFTVDGVEMVYGYLAAERAAFRATRSTRNGAGYGAHTCGWDSHCDACC